MNVFFDENGMFRLDEMATKSQSFQKIMEDEIVTDEEIVEQTERVHELFQRMEKSFSPEQLELIADSITQLAVLYAITQYQQLQEFNNFKN